MKERERARAAEHGQYIEWLNKMLNHEKEPEYIKETCAQLGYFPTPKIGDFRTVNPVMARESCETKKVVVYTDYFPQGKIKVNGTLVSGIDPLFVTPGLRGFKEEETNDLTVDTNHYVVQLIPITFKDSEKNIQIRFVKFPAGFASKPDKGDPDKESLRWKIMKENQGIIFKRLR